MKELTQLQKEMLDDWAKKAENTDYSVSDVQNLSDRLSALIHSIEYERPVSYFPRIIK